MGESGLFFPLVELTEPVAALADPTDAGALPVPTDLRIEGHPMVTRPVWLNYAAAYGQSCLAYGCTVEVMARLRPVDDPDAALQDTPPAAAPGELAQLEIFYRPADLAEPLALPLQPGDIGPLFARQCRPRIGAYPVAINADAPIEVLEAEHVNPMDPGPASDPAADHYVWVRVTLLPREVRIRCEVDAYMAKAFGEAETPAYVGAPEECAA